MPKTAPTGMLALPLVLLGGSLALAAAAKRAPAPAPGARVELELVGVLPMPEGQAGVLILREKGRRTILPLVVPEGRRFSPGASGGTLLDRAIEALGGRVSEVEIDRADETSAGARVRLSHAGKPLELQGTPSECIALAMSAGVRIMTSRRLLDEEGLTPEDFARAHARDRKGQPTRL